MLTTFEWIVWAVAVFIALSLTYGAVRRLLAKQPVMRATLYQGIFLWAVSLFLLFTPTISKLHLIWIVPICFPLIGYLTFRSATQRVEEAKK